MPTGLPTLINMIGIVEVWRLTAADALEPTGTSSPADQLNNGLIIFRFVRHPYKINNNVFALDQIVLN
jgi:hypothetical protein